MTFSALFLRFFTSEYLYVFSLNGAVRREKSFSPTHTLKKKYLLISGIETNNDKAKPTENIRPTVKILPLPPLNWSTAKAKNTKLTAEEKSTGNFPYNLPSITYFCLLLIFATVGLFLIKIILVNFLNKKRNFIILTRRKIKFFHFAARGSVIQIVLARTVYRFTCAFPNF